jgi:S1-C subfamily serine protease
LKLAKVAPRLLDKVTMAGHPFGWDAPTVMVGTVAAVRLRFTTDPSEFPFTKHYMILQVSGAPGNSGSSVVNEKLEVVSVIQISWGRSFEPIMGSAPFAELARFAGKYFAK